MESFSGNLLFESCDIQTDHDIEKNITQSFNKLGKRRHLYARVQECPTKTQVLEMEYWTFI